MNLLFKTCYCGTLLCLHACMLAWRPLIDVQLLSAAARSGRVACKVSRCSIDVRHPECRHGLLLAWKPGQRHPLLRELPQS